MEKKGGEENESREERRGRKGEGRREEGRDEIQWGLDRSAANSLSAYAQ